MGYRGIYIKKERPSHKISGSSARTRVSHTNQVLISQFQPKISLKTPIWGSIPYYFTVQRAQAVHIILGRSITVKSIPSLNRESPGIPKLT